MQYTYGIFGYEFALELSTRPEEKFLGDIETWNKAEGMIADALNAFGKPWKLNPGDGAFYGPKIGTYPLLFYLFLLFVWVFFSLYEYVTC